MYKFAGFIRRTRRTIGAHDQKACVGHGLADRVRTVIDFGGLEVGRAERLGQTIHEVGFGLRKQRAQALQDCPGHAAAGIGKVAQRGARCIGPASMGQLHPKGRHARDRGDTLTRAGLYHVLWTEIIDKDSSGAARPRRRELAQACIEAKR